MSLNHSTLQALMCGILDSISSAIDGGCIFEVNGEIEGGSMIITIEIKSKTDSVNEMPLDELVITQNGHPMGEADVRALLGTWPGDKDDGFEADIYKLRHRGTSP